MKLSLDTRIIIKATPAQVWEVLTDFAKYPEWNPFVQSLQGEVQVGNTIETQLPGMKFTPTVMVFDANKEFRWKGKLFFRGLFDGEHFFQLKDNGDGTTTFIHGENFDGILVGLLKNKLLGETKTGFEEMNAALRERVEGR